MSGEGHGQRAEDAVEGICRESFLADFVVRAPRVRMPSGQQREIADLLLPLRDTLVALQVRSRTLPPDFDPANPQHTGRIERRISDAVEQVKTVQRALRSSDVETLTNLRGIELPFDRHAERRLVGVVVLNLELGTLSSHDLALYGGLARVRDIWVHVFLREEFEMLVRELDTIPDLMDFLNIREKLMRRQILSPGTSEADLLGMFLAKYDVIERCLAGDITGLVIDDGFWEALQRDRPEMILERKRRRGLSEVVDEIIRQLHTVIGHRLTGESQDEVVPGLPATAGTVEQYWELATELSSLKRVERMSLGERMVQKMKRADTDPKGFSYFMYKPESSQTAIVFVSARGSRPQLVDHLHKLASIVYVHLGTGRVVGIGTQEASSLARCYVFAVLEDVRFSNEDELRALAERMFGPTQAFSVDQWGQSYPPKID